MDGWTRCGRSGERGVSLFVVVPENQLTALDNMKTLIKMFCHKQLQRRYR